MALKLASEVRSTGIVGEYWRIVQDCRNYDRNETVVDLALYANGTARIAGKLPISARHIVIPGIVSGERAEIYCAIKAMSSTRVEVDTNGQEIPIVVPGEFATAENC